MAGVVHFDSAGRTYALSIVVDEGVATWGNAIGSIPHLVLRTCAYVIDGIHDPSSRADYALYSVEVAVVGANAAVAVGVPGHICTAI